MVELWRKIFNITSSGSRVHTITSALLFVIILHGDGWWVRRANSTRQPTLYLSPPLFALYFLPVFAYILTIKGANYNFLFPLRTFNSVVRMITSYFHFQNFTKFSFIWELATRSNVMPSLGGRI